MTPLPRSFYQSDDVVQIAKNLLGKALFTRFGPLTGGLIIETEAYAGVSDRASHAFGGRRTSRNEAMYGPGGTAYVYFCYGIHYLLNAVTGKAGLPHAVLIRAILPTVGIDAMLERRGKMQLDRTLCFGPGALCSALGITKQQNERPLDSLPLLIADMGYDIAPALIEESPRIGVDYAGPDALLPYRFQIIAK
jgi:DNA-3-methyladenine glycosylase